MTQLLPGATTWTRVSGAKPSRAKPGGKKRANPERSFQVSLMAWLKLALPLGAFAFAIENERRSASTDPMVQARFQMARRKSGVVAGIPDVCCVLPGGRVVWLELKAPKGVVSDAQDGLHTRMRTLGHQVGVAKTIEQAHALLTRAGVLLRAPP